jgi:hypothetical protein
MDWLRRYGGQDPGTASVRFVSDLETRRDAGNGVNRRAALKKAAAAGAIVWAAPTIISESAGAQAAVCTPKCLPVGSGTGTATATATCSGQGVRRALNINVDLSAVQTFTCPCGGTPTVTARGCTSNVGQCDIDAGGAINVSFAGRGVTGTLNIDIELTETASCPDRSPDDGDCFATCTTRVRVSIFVQDRGNCNGFPQNPTPTVTTTCTS